MKIIEIQACQNGAHRNMDGVAVAPPGWAILPDAISVPDSFPFVDIDIEDGVVTALTPRPVPEPEPAPEPEHTEAEALRADVDFLLMLAEGQDQMRADVDFLLMMEGA